MKQIADELMAKAEVLSRDQSDMKKLINRTTDSVAAFRKDHPAIAGTAEAAIGIAAIAVGASIFDPVDYGTKVPELIGAAFGAGAGGGIGGAVMSLAGGIGIAAMGTAFAIPAAAVTVVGAGAGALSGSLVGWFGVEQATSTMSLAESLFTNISGAALVAFGCYMLCLALKDLWRAGGEFVSYLKNLGVNEINHGVLS